MTSVIPQHIFDNYEVYDYHHASAILKGDFPEQFDDLISALDSFRFGKSQVLSGGGRKTPMANLLDGHLYDKGWQEKKFDIRIMIDEKELEIPTHSIDCYKWGVGIEVEWNNKDTFFDRDLNNFRLLFDLRALSVGVIITRTTKLQDLFKALVRTDGLSKDKFGSSTTHTHKLMPKVYSGAGGGCPLLIFGISQEKYSEDE